jgi:hypothetical protein
MSNTTRRAHRGAADAAFKNTLTLAAWILGLILVGGLLWVFTKPVRNRLLIQAVNQSLQQSGAAGRSIGRLHPRVTASDDTARRGYWYTLADADGGKRAYVFTFIAEGTFFPCVAILSADGKVERFLPLCNHGERAFARLPPEIIKLYTNRLEGARL